jgi:ABC-2 type transport system ATP-binding protein
VIRCLGDAAIAVDEIGVRRPTLDEVFLTLTGDHASTPASTDYAQQPAGTDYAQQGSPR